MNRRQLFKGMAAVALAVPFMGESATIRTGLPDVKWSRFKPQWEDLPSVYYVDPSIGKLVGKGTSDEPYGMIEQATTRLANTGGSVYIKASANITY